MNKKPMNSKQKNSIKIKVVICMALAILIIIGTISLLGQKNDEIEKQPDNNVHHEGKDEIETDNHEAVGEALDHSLGGLVYETSWRGDNVENLSSSLESLLFRVKANSTGKVFNENIYLKKGNYTISFEAISENFVNVFLKVLQDDDSVLIYSDTFDSGQQVSIDFSVTDTIYSADIELFAKAYDLSADVEIKNFKITSSESSVTALVNQVGYQPEQRKIVNFKNKNGDYFNIVNYETNEIEATYPLTDSILSTYTNEYIQTGDFSNFKKEGMYYIETSFGYRSESIVIDQHIYNELLHDSLSFFTMQRCGHVEDESIFNDLAHGSCHTDMATLYGTDELIDVSGGWHDAGDYGKYIETGAKALSDMLIATMIHPEACDDLAILEEMKVELDWMFKMQREDGAVYSRVATGVFADFISPDKDKEMQYILQPSTPSTAGVASVMALASEVYRESDPAYADKCLEAAKKAFNYANASYHNPSVPIELNMGDYIIKDDSNLKFFMGVALWHATNDEKYLDAGLSWIDLNNITYYEEYWYPGAVYPAYLYLDKADENTKGYQEISASFKSYADSLLGNTSRNVFRVNLSSEFTWGSNHNIVDNAMTLLMAHDVFDELNYYDVATEYLSYILGHNGLNFSFVTGYGLNYPLNIHHRVTEATDGYLKGALVGGANGGMDDPLLREKYEGSDVPDQYRYIDEVGSYASNEVAVHYNSSLYFVLSYMEYAN